MNTRFVLSLLVLLFASGIGTAQACLPTGVCLDPAGQSFDVGNMPLAVVSSPERDRLVLSLNGWRQQGIQVVDAQTGTVVQTISQPAAFFGLAFSNDGKTLYASGGNEDVVYRYSWRDKQATLLDTIVLAQKEPKKDGTRFPAGLAVSHDDKYLFVAENLGDTLAVVDLESKRVVQRFRTETYPYAVVVSRGADVFVSAWGGNTVSVFVPAKKAVLKERGRIKVGRHPSALLLNHSGSRLFVVSAGTSSIAVVDTKALRVLTTLRDAPPAGPNQGSTPNALAFSDDGLQLYVAEADNNAVGIFQLSRATAGITKARGADRLIGRIPVGWYPAALLLQKDSLFVVNGKGRGTRPNPQFSTPDVELADGSTAYTLGQLNGTVTRLSAELRSGSLPSLTSRVVRANNWDTQRSSRAYPPFDEPAGGYLWDAAIRKDITLRNYGEFGEAIPNKNKAEPVRYRASKPALDRHTSREYPAYNLTIRDQVRADVWLKEFQEFVRLGNLPALQIMHLPGDHTSGGRAGRPTPKAYMADNDLALGRLVEVVSRSPYWKDTVFFVLEDDAQDGPDHIDSHRSVLLVISAYNRSGVIRRFVNTTDVLATVEEILGLGKLSKFDHYGRPLREIFTDTPDLTPYVALKPEQSLDELNPPKSPTAQASLELDLDRVDAAEEDAFNRILWILLKGSQPFPGAKRMSSQEMVRAQ